MESWKEKRTLDNYFDCENSDSLNLLQKLIKTFPQEEFKELYPLFLEWENYTEYMIKNNQSKVEISLLVEKFWFLFAKKLRILVNENINAETVVHWQSDYEKSLKDFERFLFDFSREF